MSLETPLAPVSNGYSDIAVQETAYQSNEASTAASISESAEVVAFQPAHHKPTAKQQWPSHNQFPEVDELPTDHFITRDGVEFAGTHLIIDLWGANHLDDLELMETTMRQAVEEAGATLLHIHLHHFTPNGGISGVAVLAESHISVHTWPERDFAAFDVFMCGDAKPELCVPVLQQAFNPKKVSVGEHLRGKTILETVEK